MNTAEEKARRFHEAYERLAPDFGYETRRESAVPWEAVPEQNRKLMTAVCAEVCGPDLAVVEAAEAWFGAATVEQMQDELCDPAEIRVVRALDAWKVAR